MFLYFKTSLSLIYAYPEIMCCSDMPPLAKHVFICMENIFLNDRMILLNMHTHTTPIISNTMAVLCRLYILKYFHCA